MPAKRNDFDAIEMQSTCTEKNELLNNTEVKMRDFDSIDSEDFLEEDDEFCNGKCGCYKQRTCLEKFLFVLLVIALCVVIGLIAKSSNKTNTTVSSVCQTKGCVDVASMVLSSMDDTVNPCTDFYKYACGGWEKDTPIPPGFSYWDRTQELAYKNTYHLHHLIESYNSTEGGTGKTKKFHDSCIRVDSVNSSAIIQKFQDLIHMITGVEDNFTFPVVLEKVHKLNSWPLFTVEVGPDEREEDRNVVKISQSDMPYPIHVLLNHNSTDKYLKWDAKQVKKRYLSDMTRTLKMFWNKSEADSKRIAEDLLKLDLDIAKTRHNTEYMYNRASVYNKTTVAGLQQKCNMLDWELYLTSLTYDTATIKNTDTVAVLHEDRLQDLCNVIRSYEDNKENKTVLYYYLVIHAVRSFMPYFEVATFADLSEETEMEFDGEQWRRCTFYTNKAFGFATAAMYINRTAHLNNVQQIQQLIQDVKDAFKEFVLKKIWFRGDHMRQIASNKIDQMLEKINYPTYILQKKFLDRFYNKIEVGMDWFSNLLNWKKFEVSRMFTELGKKTDRNSWIRPPFTEESDYDPVRNELNFPIAMLHLPFYTTDGPQPFNYGTLAAVVGHEITHAFDVVGRQYNAEGKLQEWWDPLTISSFNKTASCMKDQYDRFKLDDHQINGYQTLDENIADGGGIRAAFFAYQLWERKGITGSKLPGVNLSNRQLFFISYAQMFCSKWKPEGLQKHIIDDKHSPGPIRVKGAISNINTFADEFDCPFISNYNPEFKCEVW